MPSNPKVAGRSAQKVRNEASFAVQSATSVTEKKRCWLAFRRKTLALGIYLISIFKLVVVDKGDAYLWIEPFS
jgi:hypothetical protein